MGDHDVVQTWMEVVSAFNAGNTAPLLGLFDQDCAWPGVGSNATEIRERIKYLVDQGWSHHEVLSVASAGPLVVALAHNTMKDGSSWHAAGILRFGDNDKLVEVRSLNYPQP